MYFRCGPWEFKVGGYHEMSEQHLKNWPKVYAHESRAELDSRHYQCEEIVLESDQAIDGAQDVTQSPNDSDGGNTGQSRVACDSLAQSSPLPRFKLAASRAA